MTNPNHTETPPGEYSEDDRARSVEDEWAGILQKYTDDTPDEQTSDDQTQRILRALQSHPALALGAPTRDQIDSTTRVAIDELDFVKHGPADNEDEAEQITKELKRALKDGLHGDRVGPSSLMKPYELQAAPDRLVPPEEDKPRPIQPNPMSNDHEPHDDSTDRTDTDAEPADPEPDDQINVEPAELNPEADANPGAPGGAGAAGAAQPADEPDDASVSDEQVPSKELDIELNEFIAEQVVGRMDDEEGLTEEQKQVAYNAAQIACILDHRFIRDHLLSSLDENAREIVFESAVIEPAEDEIKQIIREQ